MDENGTLPGGSVQGRDRQEAVCVHRLAYCALTGILGILSISSLEGNLDKLKRTLTIEA